MVDTFFRLARDLFLWLAAAPRPRPVPTGTALPQMTGDTAMSIITLRNNTNEVVRLAIFKTPVLQPTLGTIAWQVATPPVGGVQTIQIRTAG